MSFASISIGSPFYILKTQPDLVLETGIIKNKVEKRPAHTNNYGFNINFPNPVNQDPNIPIILTVDVNGKEMTLPEIPGNIDIASSQDGSILYTGNREELAHSIEGIIQVSQTALSQASLDKHRSRIDSGNKLLEQLNPRYAEQQEQARTIQELKDSYGNLTQAIGDIRGMLQGILANSQKTP